MKDLKNVVTVVLARHGKKDGFNSNRISNPEEVVQIASKFNLFEYDKIVVRSTPIERALHTALCIKDGIVKSGYTIGPVEVYELTSGVLSTGGIDVDMIMAESEDSKDINLISSSIREVYKKAVESCDESSWTKEDAGVASFMTQLHNEKQIITHGGMKIFKENQLNTDGISMLETILRISKHFFRYTEEEPNSWFYEVNHAGFIEPWLCYLTGFSLKEMGGAFEPSETVEIIFFTEEITFHLRGKTYKILVSKLEEDVSLLEKISISEEILRRRKIE